MTAQIKGYNKNSLRATTQGEWFNVDYGFVRGKEVIKNGDGPVITSKEGYNYYVLVVDEYSRHLWVFLFANKSPPIDTIKTFLSTHGHKSGLRRIRTDQGGELDKSTAFRRTIIEAGYTF